MVYNKVTKLERRFPYGEKSEAAEEGAWQK